MACKQLFLLGALIGVLVAGAVYASPACADLVPLPPQNINVNPDQSKSDPPAVESSSVEAPKTEPAFDKERFQREVTNSKDLPNFHEVHPFLFRGGEPTEKGLRDVKARGVGTIIDLRGGDTRAQEKTWAKNLGLKYINMPMSAEPPTKKQIDTLITTIKDAQANRKNGSVFVHCAHGSDRTGCMIGIWRVTQDGWNYEDAYKEMRHYWFGPKFTKLSGAVREQANHAGAKASPTPVSLKAR